MYILDQRLSIVYIHPQAPTSPAIHNLEQQRMNKFVRLRVILSIHVSMIEGPGVHASINQIILDHSVK